MVSEGARHLIRGYYHHQFIEKPEKLVDFSGAQNRRRICTRLRLPGMPLGLHDPTDLKVLKASVADGNAVL